MIDLVFPDGNEEELSKMAKRLGWEKICFAYNFTNLADTKAKLKRKPSAVVVTQKNFMQAKFADIILQRAEDDPLPALKTGKIHGLIGVEKCRITQVHCKLAVENNVAFGLGLSGLLERPKSIDWIHRNSRLINKYKVPLILGSFARNPYEMRSYHDLSGLFMTLGIDKGLVKKGFEFLEKCESQ